VPCNKSLMPDLPPISPRREGDPAAANEWLPLVYDELRRIAADKLSAERPGHTLQATALVHEAWLRLCGGQHEFQNRGHFFAAAAEAMRRLLIDSARRKARLKRGGNCQRIDLDTLDLAATADDETLLAVNDALDRLATVAPVGAELIKLRFFVGLSNVEAANVLGLSERTAKRTWAYARAWLYAELTREP
jgi:RNA polymerase sigma factor (TIGR02999 family)